MLRTLGVACHAQNLDKCIAARCQDAFDPACLAGRITSNTPMLADMVALLTREQGEQGTPQLKLERHLF